MFTQVRLIVPPHLSNYMRLIKKLRKRGCGRQPSAVEVVAQDSKNALKEWKVADISTGHMHSLGV